jgi:MYXO-CTERM domain-containing protein
MKSRLLTSLVLGASLPGGAATAAPFIATFEAHNDMHAGALWRNDRPNNNAQRGGGCEHQAMTVLKGGKLIIVCTGSYTDVTPMIAGAGLSSLDAGIRLPTDGDPGVQATGNRVEGLCVSYQLDATKGLVKTNMAYFTNNNSPDWQNMHKPMVAAIDGGKAALVLYGHDPNGNRTRVYGKVVGPNCELMSAQTQLFASNNDDYGGIGAPFQPVMSDVNGTTRVAGCHIGNGNGNDDGWCFGVSTQSTGQPGAAAYTVKPDFHIVTEPQEERTRPFSLATPFKDMMLACWSKGNNRPTDSVRCGMINTAPGVPDAERLVWRQYVMERVGNLHYTTPAVAPVTDANGNPTDKYIVTYVKVDTTNRQGRAKARTAIQTVPIQITTTGFKMLDKPVEGLFGMADGAHPGLNAAVYGAEKRPVAFMFAGSITDGGPAPAKIVGLTADGKLEPIRALNWASSSSGGYTSQWYGHNPNTPQGRSSPVQSVMVDNLGYHTPGGYQPDVKTFLAVANIYHNDHSSGCTPDPNKGTNNGTCGGKNALGVVLIPVAADPSTGNPGNPDDPTPIDPTGDENGTTLGGCSTGSTTGSGALLLGLAALLIRRRRSN